MKHVARKRFGQHFLVDAGVIGRIVDEIGPRAGQALVEIGPGLGALTHPVLDRGASLTLVEIDRDLAARWRREAERSGERGARLRVIEADALDMDWRALAAGLGQPLRLIGNLPYNISSPILFSLLPVADAVADQHFMLQKEVVDRMVADPGSRTFGRLSVMLQWRYAMDAWAEVPPEAFDPPPQVDSAMVHMVPRPMTAESAAPVAAVLETLAQAAFSQRRKLLRHALEPWIERERTRRAAPALPDFDLQRRAEEVPVADYVALATALAAAPVTAPGR